MRKFLTLVCGPIGTLIFGAWTAVRLILDALGRADIVTGFSASDSVGTRAIGWLLKTPWYVPAALALILVLIWVYFAHKILIAESIAHSNQPTETKESVPADIGTVAVSETSLPDLEFLQNRRQLIKQGRRLVQKVRHNGGGDTEFRVAAGINLAFYELRPHLSPEFETRFANWRGASLPGADGLTALPLAFLKELERLESEWGLVRYYVAAATMAASAFGWQP